MDGWIKLHRTLLDNPLWKKGPFSEGQAWVDLLLLAEHRGKTFLYRGRSIFVERGSVMISLRELGKRWGWGKDRVSRFLQYLEAQKMCDRNRDKVRDRNETLLTIANYGVYQDSQDTSRDTTRDTSRDALPIKEEYKRTIMSFFYSDGIKRGGEQKKGRPKRPETLPKEHDAYKAAEYMAKRIKKRAPNFPQVQDAVLEKTIQRWAKDIEKLLRIDKVNFDDFKSVLSFSQTDPFWSKNILSGEKLREQFGRLLMELGERNESARQ